MVALFLIFATMPLVGLKILGPGTEAALLIDATVVRGALVRPPWPCLATTPGSAPATRRSRR